MDYNILVSSLQIGYRLDFNQGTGTFTAVKEAKGQGRNKRAKGETTKNLYALNRAVNELKTTLETTQSHNFNDLVAVHNGLSKRINHIQSHTTGIMGWVRSIGRGKKETADLKKLGKELNQIRSLIHRTQGVAAFILTAKFPHPEQYYNKKNSLKIFNAIKAEFPQLVHSGEVTNASFGMSEQDPKPKVPFLITKGHANDSFFVHYPKHHRFANLDFQVIQEPFNSFQDFPRVYENRVHLYGRAVENAISKYVYTTLHLHCLTANGSPLNGPLRVGIELKLSSDVYDPHSILNFSYINPETNKVETEKIYINLMTTSREVQAKIDAIIQQNKDRVDKIKSFLQANFIHQGMDENGILYDRNFGNFLFHPTFLTIALPAVQVAGLGRDSYEKIKDIKTNLEKNITYLESQLDENKTMTLDGFNLKFLFDSTRQQIVVKDASNNQIHQKISYADNLEEKLQDLAKLLPLKTNIQLSAASLDSVSPFSEASHIVNVPDVSVSKLKEFKNQIDFSGHDLTTADDGASISQAKIVTGIDKIVNTIEAYRAGRNCDHYGIPSAHKPEERKKYFDDLEARLTHIIDALEKPEKRAMLSEVMINLGVGGNHCGGRWKDEVSKYYSMLCRPQVNEKNIPLDSWLQIRCDQTKQEIVEAMVLEGDGRNTAHIRNRYLKSLKEQGVAVPGWEAAMYDDPFRREGGGLMENDKILKRFNSQLDFATFIEESKEEINKRIQNFAAASICQNFGSQVINRLRTAVKVMLLPHLPEKQAEFVQKTTEEAKNLFLDNLIDELQLVTNDEITIVLNGVTTRGMALLALQTEVMKFKKDEMNPLAFIQSI